jgi:hypothetical protein
VNHKGVILTSELDDIARQGLDDLRAVFAGKMDGKTLIKANMVLKLLGVSKGRYSAETNRMALMFRMAKAANVSSAEYVSMLRQVMGVSVATEVPKAIGDGGGSAAKKQAHSNQASAKMVREK